MDQTEPKPGIPLEPQTQLVLTKRPTMIVGILCFAALVGIAALFLTGKLPLPFSFPGTSVDRATFLRQLAERNVDFGKHVDELREQTNWSSAERQLDRCEHLAAELAAVNASLDKEFTRLEAAAGSPIAGRTDLLDQYMALRESPRIPDSELQAIRTSVQTYRDLCRDALGDRSVVISYDEKFEQELAHLFDETTRLLKAAREDRAALQVLVAAAQDSPPTPETLSAAIARRKDEQMQERLQKLAADLDALRRQSDEKVRSAELQAEQTSLAAQEKFRIAEAQARSDKAKAIVEEALRKLAAEKARSDHLAKFDKSLPEIRSLLSPMISRGKMQLAKNGTGWREEAEAAPLSLTAIKAIPGFQGLGGTFCSPTQNDRPRGGFPEKISNNIPTIERARELLIEFGDTLVEREMLRP